MGTTTAVLLTLLLGAIGVAADYFHSNSITSRVIDGGDRIADRRAEFELMWRRHDTYGETRCYTVR